MNAFVHCSSFTIPNEADEGFKPYHTDTNGMLGTEKECRCAELGLMNTPPTNGNKI